MKSVKVFLVLILTFATFTNASKCPCNKELDRVIEVIERNIKVLTKSINAYDSGYCFFLKFLKGYKKNLYYILDGPFGLPGSLLASQGFRDYIGNLIRIVEICQNAIEKDEDPLTTFKNYFTSVRGAFAGEITPSPPLTENSTDVEKLDAASTTYWTFQLTLDDETLNRLPESIEEALLYYVKGYREIYEVFLKSVQEICVCLVPGE